VASLFFLVSGENPSLPFAEVTAILEAEGFAYRLLSKLTQVLILEADLRCLRSIARRSSLTRSCGPLIVRCEARAEEILRTIKRADFASYISPGEDFAVRIRRVRGSSPEINGLTLEREIGGVIYEAVKGTRANLRSPRKSFFGILSDGEFIFGLKTAEIKAGEFTKRGPPRTVFTHSAAMPPKIARCMVNLTRTRAGDLVLDPFCGTGSFLVEAGLIGCRVMGADVKRRMIEGSVQNLSACGIEPEGLFVADARFPPIPSGSIKCVVTDPPYGTSTTTLGLRPSEVFEEFFSAAGDYLEKGGRVCLAAPKTIEVSRIGEELGFKHKESHFIYIHRRLTREIAVFSK
jgi:tRNA (guanine10-N2)-dimethyltransferase